MKYFFAIIGILAICLAYFLVAKSPVMIMQVENSDYKNVYTWVGNKNPIALPLSRSNQSVSQQTKSQYFFSKSRNYYGKVVHNNQQIEVSWYDADQTQQGMFSEEWPDDIAIPRYFIHSNLSQIFSVDIFNRIRFINADGKLNDEISLFKNLTYNNENNTYCQYLEQNDQLILGIKQVYPVSDVEQGYNSYLTLLDLQGNEVFSIRFPGWQINGVSASTNGEYFLIPLHKYVVKDKQFIFRTLLIDNQGSVIDDIPVQHNKAVFNANSTRIAFFKNERAWLYDITTNKIIREFSGADNNKIFISGLFIDEKGMLILQEGEVYKDDLYWAFRELTLYLIDYEGELIQQHELKDITQFTPVMRYDAMTEQLFVGHRSGYQYYMINN